MKALGRFSKRFYLKQVIICIQVYLLVVLGPLCGSAALATPINPSIKLGDPTVSVGSITTVTMNTTDRAVINWDGLDTLSTEELHFVKDAGNFAVLNRVIGGATKFDGKLFGNQGHIIIVNPNGIVFGSTAVINAFKFTASGLSINSTNYTSWYNGSGELKFTLAEGDVINNSIEGISAEQVHLIGKNVTNNGTIRTTSPDGLVVMAAGGTVFLAESGSSVVVDTGYEPADNIVTNTGTIDAAGGTIRLAAGDIFSQAAIEDAGAFVAEADRDITLEAPVQTTGDITIWADKLGDTQGDVYAGADATITANSGNVTIRGNEVKLYGAVKAGIDEFGNVTPDKDLTIKGRDCWGGDEAEWRDVWAYSTLEASRDIIISDTGATETKTWVPNGKCGGGEYVYDTEYEPGTINLFGDVTAGRDLTLYNITNTGPDVTLMAGQDIRLEYYEDNPLGTTPPSFCEYLTGDTWLALRAGNEIKAPETIISVTGSTLIMEQGLSINLDSFLFDLQGTTNLTLISNDGSVTAVDTGTKPENAADKWHSIGATAYDDITLSGSGSIRSGDSGTDTTKSLWAINGDIDVDAGQDFSADKDIEAGSDVTVMAGDNILLMGDATAGQNITLDAVDDVEVQGDLVATTGNIEIYASEDTIYLWGDTTAGGNILLNNNTEFEGSDDQYVEAGGTITANGWLNKLNDESDGSLYLHANGDISLADFVQAASFEDDYGGGVSIISDNGRIVTTGDTLNVPVTGRSVDSDNDTEDVGVILPYDSSKKAAILIMSSESLKLGGGAEMKACGTYDNTGADDRAGINFLDIDAEIPAGVPRDPGQAFDLAIYAASKNGSVEIDCPVTIASSTIPLPTILMTELTEQQEQQRDAAGTMVVDAHNTVSFGENFEGSLAAGRVGNHLEVASRITEWLEDAITFERLPYADDAEAMSMLWYGNTDSYVLRGAGAENRDIGDGAPAWVLEGPDDIEPFGEAAPIQEPVGIKIAGCPALTSWLAGELGVNAEQVQVLFANARGYKYDNQPCDTCARLQGAARVLMDSDGSRIAALAKVVNEYAATGAPPSEEQMAMIASAMENPEEGSDYALASEWLDAMTEYVSILNTELGLATEDAVATAGKYVSPVTTSDNTAVAGYVSVRLAEIGG
jgi:filamentous hemagglutinin family protein